MLPIKASSIVEYRSTERPTVVRYRAIKGDQEIAILKHRRNKRYGGC